MKIMPSPTGFVNENARTEVTPERERRAAVISGMAIAANGYTYVESAVRWCIGGSAARDQPEFLVQTTKYNSSTNFKDFARKFVNQRAWGPKVKPPGT